MKVDNAIPSKLLKDKALDVKIDRQKFGDQSRKRLFFWRWLFSFVTLIIVPNCQSMPSQIPPSYTVIINQIEHKNAQTVNVSYNINIQNE